MQTHPLNQLDGVIGDIYTHIHDYTKSKNDFTRNRKLPADKLIKTMINMQGNCIESELKDQFDKDVRMSESAFEQAKGKLTPKLFEDLFHQYNKTMTDPKTLDLVQSYRVYAIDGTDSNPPYQSKSKYALEYQYGRPRKDGSENKRTSQIHGNAMYDLLNRTYEDLILQPRSAMDERTAALEILGRMDNSKPFIAVMDRGYEGFNFIEHLNRMENCHYIIRAKNGEAAVKELQELPDEECDFDITYTITTSATFYRKNKHKIPHLKLIPKSKRHYKDEIAKSTKDRRWDFEELCTVKCRIVKIRINNPDTGKEEWEVLITNLNRFEFPAAKMKEMYNMRWGIETSFRNLKYAVSALNFHSKKDDFVEMELYARFIMYNATSRCINNTSVPQNTENKHTYALSFKMAVQVTHDYLSYRHHDPYDHIYSELLMYRVAVRPDRKDVRKIMNLKPKSAVWFVYRVA